MIEAILTVMGTGILAIAGWAVMLQSRVAVLEADRLSIIALVDRRFDDVLRRLARIEDKLDREGVN